MKLSPSQVKTIKRITNQTHKYYGSSSAGTVNNAMSFRIGDSAFPDGSVMLVCGNAESGLRWFETHHHAVVIIGPKGGIKYFDGDMKRSLIVD